MAFGSQEDDCGPVLLNLVGTALRVVNKFWEGERITSNKSGLPRGTYHCTLYSKCTKVKLRWTR